MLMFEGRLDTKFRLVFKSVKNNFKTFKFLKYLSSSMNSLDVLDEKFEIVSNFIFSPSCLHTNPFTYKHTQVVYLYLCFTQQFS